MHDEPEVIRKLRQALRKHDYYGNMQEAPIDDVTPAIPVKWLESLRLFRVHVGFDSPKDPIPSPSYYVIDSVGKLVEDLCLYFNHKGTMPADAAEAAELAMVIVQTPECESLRIVTGTDSLAPCCWNDMDEWFIQDFLDSIPESERLNLHAPEVNTTPEGYTVALWAYHSKLNTKHRKVGNSYTELRELIIQKGTIHFIPAD